MMNHVLENVWQDFLVTTFESLSFVENIKYALFDDVVGIIIVFVTYRKYARCGACAFLRLVRLAPQI